MPKNRENFPENSGLIRDAVLDIVGQMKYFEGLTHVRLRRAQIIQALGHAMLGNGSLVIVGDEADKSLAESVMVDILGPLPVPTTLAIVIGEDEDGGE